MAAGTPAALRHRGPDGVGHYRSADLAMVQTRLAIIDLETGAQPLYEPAGAALIANAEIYNYLELREKLSRSVLRPERSAKKAAPGTKAMRICVIACLRTAAPSI